MADAKKCDICGTFYNMYGKASGRRENIEPNTIYLSYAGPLTMGMDCKERYDLCPECLEKFYEFVGVKNETNQ